MEDWAKRLSGQKFKPERGNPLYPDPTSVIRYYMKLRQVGARQLGKELGVSASAVRYTLLGVRINRYSFRRQMCQLLAIPPELLGLDSKKQWKIDAEFDYTEDGYPLAHQVVVFYRRHKRKEYVPGSDKASSWTQHDLAETLDLSDCAMYLLEKKGKGLDFMDRRRALSFMLGIPPALLGLYIPSTDTPKANIIVPTNSHSLVDTLASYQKQLAAIYNSYLYEGNGEQHFSLLKTQLSGLAALRKDTNNDQQQQQITDTIIQNHRYYILVSRETCDYQVAIPHANKAVSLATSSLDDSWQSRERLAEAYIRRAEMWREAGNMQNAISDANQALWYSKGTSQFAVTKINIEVGTIHALAGNVGGGYAYSMELFDKAERALSTAAPWNDSQPKDVMHRSFFDLRLVMALQGSSEFENAQKAARMQAENSGITRRVIILDIEKAKSLALLEPEEAAKLAIQALDQAKSINSVLNRRRIDAIYQSIKQYDSIPAVQKLGWMLTSPWS